MLPDVFSPGSFFYLPDEYLSRSIREHISPPSETADVPLKFPPLCNLFIGLCIL
jgi:hypothetical protein